MKKVTDNIIIFFTFSNSYCILYGYDLSKNIITFIKGI